MNRPYFEIIRYDSIEDCMAAFFRCEPEELPEGKWEWSDGGRTRVWPMRRVLRVRRKMGMWGWCENKTNIHVWIADHAEPSRIIRLLAHELGHKERPHKRLSIEEEAKAEQYAYVAETAFRIMLDMGIKI